MVGPQEPNEFDELTDTEARNLLAFLLSHFRAHHLDMGGRSLWRFHSDVIYRHPANSPLRAVQRAYAFEQEGQLQAEARDYAKSVAKGQTE